MNRTMVVGCVLALTVLASGSSPSKKKGTVCWPLHFAGITVGSTTDAQAQRLLGKGVSRHDEGHSGGRYFIDEKRTATLHLIGGVDDIVEKLRLRSGIDRELKETERAAAVSKWFDPKEGFGNWHALHLGSSKDQALGDLGEPQKRITRDEWVYESVCSCELPEYLTLKFKQDRVVELDLYAGE